MSRYRLFISAFALTALTLILLVTASPASTTQAAPRSIPWDCSDWQESPAVADADDARVSMILETLAANRGKSIYCAIDQSDTWTKSETWLAGRDRNERDDTVYFGESGNFRGFLAAQEGYLTDGESGVTGVSRELIFEFPREERRGWKTVIKRLKLAASPDRLARSRDGSQSTSYTYTGAYGGGGAGTGALGQGYRFFCNSGGPGFVTGTHQNYGHARYCQGVNWEPLVQAAAERDCAALGYPRARNSATSGNWEFQYRDADGRATHFAMIFWQVRQYTATCEKKIRVRRR